MVSASTQTLRLQVTQAWLQAFWNASPEECNAILSCISTVTATRGHVLRRLTVIDAHLVEHSYLAQRLGRKGKRTPAFNFIYFFLTLLLFLKHKSFAQLIRSGCQAYFVSINSAHPSNFSHKYPHKHLHKPSKPLHKYHQNPNSSLTHKHTHTHACVCTLIHPSLHPRCAASYTFT